MVKRGGGKGYFQNSGGVEKFRGSKILTGPDWDHFDRNRTGTGLQA